MASSQSLSTALVTVSSGRLRCKWGVHPLNGPDFREGGGAVSPWSV